MRIVFVNTELFPVVKSEKGRFLNVIFKWQWKSLTRVWLFVTPWTIVVPGILQTKILEWVAFPFSRGSSQPKDQTQVSRIAGGFFTSWATREAHILKEA